jgi:hypothetical protein
MEVDYADIADVIPPRDRPWLDRTDTLEDRRLGPNAGVIREWFRDGVVHLPGFMPDELIARYLQLRERFNRPGGWQCPVPYLYYRELRDICLYPPLMDTMRALIGYPMGLHLNLTGFISTERALHADDYLNPSFVNSHYCAAWIALDDIRPECGPFEYVPGSHKWPTIRRTKIFDRIAPALQKGDWPGETQRWVEAACLREIERRGARIEAYLPKRGDVLLWHGCLLHRGSAPSVPGAPRKALIAHYSSLRHRPDMPVRRRWRGQTYFVVERSIDSGSPAPTVSRTDLLINRLLGKASRLAERRFIP